MIAAFTAFPRRSSVRRAVCAALVALAIGTVVPPVLAQDADVSSLIQRIDRLQREMVTLQRHIYRGEPPPEPAPLPASPQTAPGDSTNTAVARMELRLSQLEAQLRQLTGSVEEATYRQNQVRERLDALAMEMNQRLQRLEQAGPAVAGAELPGGQAGLPPPSPGTEPVDPGQPRVIGTVSQEDVAALRAQKVELADTGAAAQSGATQPGAAQPGTQQTASLDYPLQGATPQEQYQHAFSLLSQANYTEAELALRTFIEQHPSDPLAGNAKYWLGETHYVRQDFQQAAITFAEAYQEYPDNSKAPDNLLKLGMSLSALGNNADACGTFDELLKRYPNAAVTVAQRAEQERLRLACP